MKTYILLDGSNYCFHRFHSLLNWWKMSHPTSTLTTEEIVETEEYIEKYKKTFVDNLKNMKKRLKVKENVEMYIGKDCKRENIWRLEHYMNYKTTRKSTPEIKYFFEMIYRENLFIKGGVTQILQHEHLEADDCIAITTKYLLQQPDTQMIYIISSDKDFLQLSCSQVKIYDLSFKEISKERNAEKELFLKIVLGDKSDNICPIIKKCGNKKAEKYYEDNEIWENLLNENSTVRENYEKNRLLIDFNYIPLNYVTEFTNTIATIATITTSISTI